MANNLNRDLVRRATDLIDRERLVNLTIDLVNIPSPTGYEGDMETVFGRGQIVTGIGMLTGSVAGGFIAAQVSLGTPFVLRGVILIFMFLLAARMMHDVGFQPIDDGTRLRARAAVRLFDRDP